MEVYLDERSREVMKPDDIQSSWRLSGYPLVRDKQGRVLMVKPTWNTLWELPGGGIELNDASIQAGIIRECYEETGYRIEVDDGLPFHFSQRNFYSSGGDRYYKAVIMVYPGRLIDPVQYKEVINTIVPNEISQVDWVDPGALTEGDVHPIAWPSILRIQ